MKVKAIINFNDKKENVSRKIGDIFECSKERADYLLEHKAIEVIEEPKTDITENEFEIRSEEVKKLVNEKVKEVEEIIKPKSNKKKKTSKK